jgi:hypothetical protein
MSRHPYTHAADFIRALGPVNRVGVVLSRSDASQIRSGIAQAIGMSDEELAIKLSEAEQAKSDATREEEMQRVMRAILNAEGGAA